MTEAHLTREDSMPVMAESFEDFGEKCGVFGIYEPDTDVAATAYAGMVMLKHRGQDAAGILVADGRGDLHLHKNLGNVKEVFDDGDALPALLPTLGTMAMGHLRYGTMNSVPKHMRWHAAQPIEGLRNKFAGEYNGDVANIHEVMDRHGVPASEYVSDTEAVIKLVDLYMDQMDEPDLVEALKGVLPQLEGAFSGVFTDGKRLVAVRDPNGFRPLVYGRTTTGGHVVASEVRALREVMANIDYEVQPGTMLVIDEEGVKRERFTEDRSTPCSYEYFYFSKEDNIFHGQVVGDVRKRFGAELAREHPHEADIVIGVPNSGVTAAEAYAKELQMPYEQAVLKNKNKESDLRSFLANNQDEREAIALAKFWYDKEVIAGKSVVLVDDSVIRGTVSKILIQQLREAGATEVHVRVPAPMYKYACHYGMDTGRVDELLATGRTHDEMRDFIGADSLEFLSAEGVSRAVKRTAGRLCMACSTGDYPTDIPVQIS